MLNIFTKLYENCCGGKYSTLGDKPNCDLKTDQK